jgi:hypothetical protein
MKERNLCTEAGCAAACCFGSWFIGSYKEKTVLRYFPTAKKVSYKSFQNDLDPGVYYYKFLGAASIRIVGQCPNLGEENSCLIHDNLPPDCANLQVSSKGCSDFRRAP